MSNSAVISRGPTQADKIRTDLIARYGVLLNHAQVAHLLQRAPRGLTWSLKNIPRGRDLLLDGVRVARIKIGRRVYYRSDMLAHVIAGESCVPIELPEIHTQANR